MVTRRDDPELAPEEREQLETGLINGFEQMHSRLGQVITGLGERAEPEGGHDPATNGAGSPQGRPPLGLSTPATNTLNVDPATASNANIESMLQQYSKTILNMVQQQLQEKK
jgi:hypothetical protein